MFYSLSLSRSGALSIVGALAAAAALTKRKLRFLAVGSGVFAAFFLVASWGLELGGGALSTRQILKVFGTISAGLKENPLETKTDGTAVWRLNWWNIILDNTVYGEYFWTGRGYGRNIAVEDGYESEKLERGDRPLRSPHNGHLNYLARSGVPGGILWVTLQLTWAGQVLVRVLRSRAKGSDEWNARFAFLLCFWLALMTNAFFSVFLENPVGGIWLWTVFGVGLASMHAFDAEMREKRTART